MARRQAAAKATRSFERCLPLRAYRKTIRGGFLWNRRDALAARLQAIRSAPRAIIRSGPLHREGGAAWRGKEGFYPSILSRDPHGTIEPALPGPPSVPLSRRNARDLDAAVHAIP
jgi:hypothetical protein